MWLSRRGSYLALKSRRAFVGHSTNGLSTAPQAITRAAERPLMQQLADEVIRDLMFYGAA